MYIDSLLFLFSWSTECGIGMGALIDRLLIDQARQDYIPSNMEMKQLKGPRHSYPGPTKLSFKISEKAIFKKGIFDPTVAAALLSNQRWEVETR